MPGFFCCEIHYSNNGNGSLQESQSSSGRIIAERNYFGKRVDELEFSMDIGNHQALKLQERIKELEETKTS